MEWIVGKISFSCLLLPSVKPKASHSNEGLDSCRWLLGPTLDTPVFRYHL